MVTIKDLINLEYVKFQRLRTFISPKLEIIRYKHMRRTEDEKFANSGVFCIISTDDRKRIVSGRLYEPALQPDSSNNQS